MDAANLGGASGERITGKRIIISVKLYTNAIQCSILWVECCGVVCHTFFP